MTKWLKWIGIVVALLVVLFVGVGFLLPSEYHVDRSVVINADPERIHELVGELKNWPEWTPWKLIDPTIQTVYGEKTSGVGAYQSWTGESGSGELTFTAWDPDRGILYDLSFDEGAYSSVGSITYEEARGGRKVTWTMDGDSGMNIIGRYFGLMIDSFVGPQFQRGLDRLKAKVESV